MRSTSRPLISSDWNILCLPDFFFFLHDFLNQLFFSSSKFSLTNPHFPPQARAGPSLGATSTPAEFSHPSPDHSGLSLSGWGGVCLLTEL